MTWTRSCVLLNSSTTGWLPRSADQNVRVILPVLLLTQVAVPPSLRLTILSRLSHVSDNVMEVLRAAAILGARFTIQDLSVSTGVAAVTLAPTVTEAVRIRVLEEDGDRLRFRHELIREALRPYPVDLVIAT